LHGTAFAIDAAHDRPVSNAMTMQLARDEDEGDGDKKKLVRLMFAVMAGQLKRRGHITSIRKL
jgi:ribosomal protein L29